MNFFDSAKQAFVTSQSCGPEKLYQLVFKFRSLEELHAAHDAWLHSVSEKELLDRLDAAERRVTFLATKPDKLLQEYQGMYRVYSDIAPQKAVHQKWSSMTLEFHSTPESAIDAAISAHKGG